MASKQDIRHGENDDDAEEDRLNARVNRSTAGSISSAAANVTT
jgi:hypothetical protein